MKPIVLSLPFTIGCDPELFLFDENDQLMTPVQLTHQYLGSKTNPLNVYHTKSSAHLGQMQVDGFAIEVNTLSTSSRPPDNLIENVLRSATQTCQFSWRLGTERPKNAKLSLRAIPTVFFSKEQYDNAPMSMKELGCDPDFNAYRDGAINPRPVPPANDPRGIMRTGGGHLHFGWGANFVVESHEHMEDCVRFIRNCDMFLFPESLKWDDDDERRRLYGERGCFRPKSYGVEYRTLSNKWTMYPQLFPWFFDMGRIILAHTAAGIDYAKYLDHKTGTVKIELLPPVVIRDLDKPVSLSHVTKDMLKLK